MPSVNVYKDGMKVDAKLFSNNFYIFVQKVDSKKLMWETGEEQKQGIHKSGGTILVWLQPGYHLPFLLPEWSLQVNGRECEKGIYVDIEIIWRKVELSCLGYNFEFLFDEESPDEMTLPHPLVRPNQSQSGSET